MNNTHLDIYSELHGWGSIIKQLSNCYLIQFGSTREFVHKTYLRL